MDAFLFVGYRFQCSIPKSKNVGRNHQIPGVEDVPINEGDKAWVYWNLPSGEDIFLYPEHGYYRCPFGHVELYDDIDREPLDLPDGHDDIVKMLMADPIKSHLDERYGRVVLKYGIMKGLG